MTAAVSQKALQPHPTPRLSWLQWVLESLRWGRKPSAEQRLNGIEPIPGPPPVPGIGSVLDIDLNDTLASAIELMKEWGPIVELWTGDQREILVGNQELHNELSDETRFVKVVYGALFHLRDAGGDGLFTSQHGAHEWGVAHRILMPNFAPLKIHDMFDGMKDIMEQLILKWARHGGNHAIDAADDFTRLTVDTICLCAMDYRMNSFYLNDAMHPYVESLSRILVESDIKSQMPDHINAWRTKADKQYRSDIQTMADICQEIIRKRRAAKRDPNSKLLLDLMIDGVDPKTGESLSDDAIMWNLHTFLIAGHDTTSGLLAFAFYFLLKFPEKMAKAKAEVEEVLGDEPIAIKHLGRLTYIDAVLKEALRLHSPAPGFHIRPLEDNTVLGGKYIVNKNDPIVTVLHLLHRDPAVWGDDADEFKPERMERDNFNNLAPNSWKPFGNGSRACIGRAFAWQEALMVMATIIQLFDLEMDDPNYDLKIIQTLTIKPDNFKMRAKLRNGKKVEDLFKTAAPQKASRTRKTNVDDQTGHPMTILYGSNTGTGEAVARWLADDATTAGFKATTVKEMNDAKDNLPKDQPVVIVAASYNGHPSDNADEFVKWLGELPPGALEGVNYSVFGLGHHDWPATFHRVPKLVDELMHKAGATRLVDVFNINMALSDLFSDAEVWSTEQLWPALGEKYDVKPEAVSDVELKVELGQPARLATRRGFFQAAVTETRQLSQPGVPEKQHLSLKLPEDVKYQTGDRLQVLPKNSADMVSRVLSRFQLDHDAVLTISSARPLALPVDTPVSAAELLSIYVELGQPASQRNVKALADAVTKDDATKAELLDLADKHYESKIRGEHVTILDLLESFPAVNLPLSKFLAMLPQMRPRTYSISSSPILNPEQADLTLSVTYGGLASNYLTSIKAGQFVHASLFPAPREFRLPTTTAMTPVIMIATGAGLAPFRGFVQERANTPTRLAPALLFYGCRGADKDDMYRAELDAYEARGVVKIHRAFSRDAGAESKYVTDALAKAKDELVKLWSDDAVVYICGGKKVSDSVFELLGPLLHEADRKAGRTSAQTVADWERELPRERYVMEIFN